MGHFGKYAFCYLAESKKIDSTHVCLLNIALALHPISIHFYEKSFCTMHDKNKFVKYVLGLFSLYFYVRKEIEGMTRSKGPQFEQI